MSKINDESGDNKNNIEIYIYPGPTFCKGPRTCENKPDNRLPLKVEQGDTLSFISEINNENNVMVCFECQSMFGKNGLKPVLLTYQEELMTPPSQDNQKVPVTICLPGGNHLGQENGTIIVKEGG